MERKQKRKRARSANRKKKTRGKTGATHALPSSPEFYFRVRSLIFCFPPLSESLEQARLDFQPFSESGLTFSSQQFAQRNADA